MPGSIYDRLKNYKPNKATGPKRAGEGKLLPYTLQVEAANDPNNVGRGRLKPGENERIQAEMGELKPNYAPTNLVSPEEEARLARIRRAKEADALPGGGRPGRISALLTGATQVLGTPSVARRLLLGA